MDWKREIVELHEHFEAYFLGAEDSLARVDRVLADDFSIVGPDGAMSDRAETLGAIEAGHGHTASLTIATDAHALIAESGDLVVAAYDEIHHLTSRSNIRRSTVVFRRNDAMPNGLEWLRVHEAWVDRGLDPG